MDPLLLFYMNWRFDLAILYLIKKTGKCYKPGILKDAVPAQASYRRL